ncbi:hypothetical protein KC357_g116 [Hortaea werneckii]|nr:hypothetical protein KC357_g116 [Hortaea werneckii]
MKPSRPTAAVMATPTYGTPLAVVQVRNLGAEPSCAKPTRIRDPEYTFELAADSTTQSRMALIRPGRTLTPANWADMTNGDAVAFVLSLSNCSLSYGTSRESGLDQDGPEADELGQCGVLGNVRGERTRVSPRVKAKVAILTCSGVDADTEDQEANHGNDLDQSKVEFDLTVPVDRSEVDGGDDGPEDADENSHVEVWSPVMDDETRSRQLEVEEP